MILEIYFIGSCISLVFLLIFLEVERRAGRENDPALALVVGTVIVSYLGILFYGWMILETVLFYNNSKFDKGKKNEKRKE